MPFLTTCSSALWQTSLCHSAVGTDSPWLEVDLGASCTRHQALPTPSSPYFSCCRFFAGSARTSLLSLSHHHSRKSTSHARGLADGISYAIVYNRIDCCRDRLGEFEIWVGEAPLEEGKCIKYLPLACMHASSGALFRSSCASRMHRRWAEVVRDGQLSADGAQAL